MTGVTPNELMGLEDNSSMDSFPTIIKPNHDSKSKTAMKEYTDKKRRAKLHDFQIGDLVVHKWSRSNKYQCLFDPDAYNITAINHSMITATRDNHQVTRNASFFQLASFLAKEATTNN